MTLPSDRFTLTSRSFDALLSETIRCIQHIVHELHGHYPDALYVDALTWRALRRAVSRNVWRFGRKFEGEIAEFKIMATPIRMLDQ